MANEVLGISSAKDLFELKRLGKPLVVTEDMVEHGKLNVYPRTIVGGPGKDRMHGQAKWDKAVSVFSAWRVEDHSLLHKMLDLDLNLSKVHKFMGNTSFAELTRAILPRYAAFVSSYRFLACQVPAYVINGVGPNVLLRWLDKADLMDEHMTSSLISNFAIQANVIERKLQQQVRVRNDQLLIRYQFLETLIRMAESKYLKTHLASGICQATQMLLKDLAPCMEERKLQTDLFRSCVFTEEIDIVFRSYMATLSTLWDIYSASSLRTTGGRMLTPCGWQNLLTDLEAYDDRFARRKSNLAFEMSMMYQEPCEDCRASVYY